MQAQVIEKVDYISLIGSYVDLFSILNVPEDKWLTTREKEYFIANVILNHKGYDLSSRKVSKILELKFGFINRGVSAYRAKLKSKGWIIQTKSGIEVPKAFNYRGISIPKEVNFEVKIKLKEKGS